MATQSQNIARPYPVTFTTNAIGEVVAYCEDAKLGTQKPRPLYGEIFKVAYTPDPANPLPDSASLTLSLEHTGEVVLAVQVGAVPTSWYPRSPALDGNAGNGGLPLSTDGDGNTTYQETTVHCDGERVKVSIVGGGAAKVGTITVYMR